MRAVSIALLLTLTPFLAGDASDTGRILTKNITGNREVRLLSAHISETRGQNLVARFQAAGDPEAEPFEIRFPAHSHTPHESTLMNIIRCGVDWSEPKDRHQPHLATRSVVFSIPADARGYVTNYESWWLVSIGPAPKE